VTRVANEIENTDPSEAGECYHYLGIAHKELGREGALASNRALPKSYRIDKEGRR